MNDQPRVISADELKEILADDYEGEPPGSPPTGATVVVRAGSFTGAGRRLAVDKTDRLRDDARDLRASRREG